MNAFQPYDKNYRMNIFFYNFVIYLSSMDSIMEMKSELSPIPV